MGTVQAMSETGPQPSSRSNIVQPRSNYMISMYSPSSMDAATPALPGTTPWFS